MSLSGLSSEVSISGDIKNDADIIASLEAKEKAQLLEQQQKEILKLMTGNREQSQYKTALNATIAEIKQVKERNKE